MFDHKHVYVTHVFQSKTCKVSLVFTVCVYCGVLAADRMNRRLPVLDMFVCLRDIIAMRLQRAYIAGVTVCPCMRFACVIRSGYLVLTNQHTSSEGQGSRDLRQTRVEPY